MKIEIDDLSRPAIHALLNEHLQSMYELSPPESVHALDLEKLRKPGITFWSAWEGSLVHERPEQCHDNAFIGKNMLKTYHGSCHCGAVKFEADLDLTQSTYRCNCSICRRTRFWPAIAKPEGFRLVKGEADLTQYLFNTRKNHHHFCKHCGVRAFGIGNETPMGKMYGVNLGCLEDASDEELSRAPITYVDGRNDQWQSTPAFFSHL